MRGLCRSLRVMRMTFLLVGLSAQHYSAARASAQPTAKFELPKDSEQDEFSRAVVAAVQAYNRDDYALARQHFERAHELRPSARTWRGLGTTAFELKFYDDAIRELTFALEDERYALPADLRAETELTLRVAQRRLAENEGQRPAAAEPLETVVAPTRTIETTLPPAKPRAAPQHVAERGLGAQRGVAIAVSAVGVVGVAIGIGFGLRSVSKGQQRDLLCPPAEQPQCSPAAVRAADSAISAGNISTIAWIAGGVGLVGAVVLWLTGGTSAEPGAAARLSVGPTTLQLSGSF